MIERGAQPIKNLPADYANLYGRLLKKSDLDYLFPFGRVDLRNDFVAIRGRKEIDEVIDLRDVAVGPFDL